MKTFIAIILTIAASNACADNMLELIERMQDETVMLQIRALHHNCETNYDYAQCRMLGKYLLKYRDALVKTSALPSQSGASPAPRQETSPSGN